MKTKIIGGALILVGFILILVGGAMLDSESLRIPVFVCLSGIGTLGIGAAMVQSYE